MDKLVRQIEIPLARNAVSKAGLYIAKESDIERLSLVAADAFTDYPLHSWFTRGKYDPVASKLILEVSMKSMWKDALIYADSEEMNGFAIWLPRSFDGSKPLPFLRHGGIKLILHSGFSIVGRLMSYESFAMKFKKECTDHSDWYLYNLTIRRDAQGKGIASKLLRPMLDFCNGERTVAYLETNKEKNVSLYEHFGFELKKKCLIPKSPVMHYAMIKKPSFERDDDTDL